MKAFGSRFALGYDIACAFFKTLMNSSLGPKACKLRIRMLVGSFHGHAHNCGCQSNWHPLYTKGAGHAALGNCESIFSASNAVMPGIHHASQFHWHQALEQHFAFLDEDMYANLSKYMILVIHGITHHDLGSFIFNHYREALEIIHMGLVKLEEI
jgi:Kyakuja-Dileera-Zisupton transposase